MRLHRRYPEKDPSCPRCHTQLGSYFHMFWECLNIYAFWVKVFDLLNLRLELSVSPRLALLGMHEDDQKVSP